MPRQTDKSLPPLQALIWKKFGGEHIQLARARLCSACLNKEQHNRPCRLYPITLEGKDCPYHLSGEISLPGGKHNG